MPDALVTIPRWALMWGLSVAIFAACKALACAAAPPSPAGRLRRAGFLLAWPGLDAAAFLGPRTATPPGANERRSAALRTLAGLALVFGLARFAYPASPWAAGWVGMTGLILALHFGSFALLSVAWRSVGVVARPLMDHPLRSQTLGEFWGRRWNTAFRDFTFCFLFRPLTRRFGPRRAVWLGFLARSFCGCVAVFWGLRLCLQPVFDVKDHLTAWWLRGGDHALTAVILAFTALYGWTALRPGP